MSSQSKAPISESPVEETGQNEHAPRSRRFLALESLKIANYRFLLTADFFGFMGFDTRLMAQSWVDLELTNSDGWVGLVAGLPAVPVMALALFGGTISDRVNRRVIQMWTFSLLAITGFVIGGLINTESLKLWHLIAIAFPVALMTTLRMTAGAAMVGDVVGRERIFGANALSTALANIGRFAGPGVGGWLLANYGAGATFHAIGAVLLLAAGLMWFVKVDNPVRPETDKSLVEEFKLGIRYISGTPELRWLTLLALSVLLGGMMMPLIPRWSRDVLGTGADGYGFILAAGGGRRTDRRIRPDHCSSVHPARESTGCCCNYLRNRSDRIRFSRHLDSRSGYLRSCWGDHCLVGEYSSHSLPAGCT